MAYKGEGYKGDDLELRTPRNSPDHGADPAEPEREPLETRGRRSGGTAGRSGPVWVDDTVLACCNHAFDVASAHRASEVRIEHLLHALTRIEPAARILEARGIRVADLRRETATVIASEIPLSEQGASTGPRRSPEFAEALRLAAAYANRRQAPAGVDDLLHVFFDVRSDFHGVELLLRHTPRPPHDISEPLASSRRTGDTRESNTPEWARETRPGGYTAPVRPDLGRADPSRSDTARPFAPDPVRVAALDPQRLDALEGAIRGLAVTLADERGAIASQLTNLQREVARQRETRPGGDTQELVARFQALDRGLDARLGEFDRNWSDLADRLQGIERLVRDARGPNAGADIDLDPLHDRLQQIDRAMEVRFSDLGRGWASLADRLQVAEKALRETRAGGGEGIALDLDPVHKRLQSIEQVLRDAASDSSRKWQNFADRLKGLDAGLQVGLQSPKPAAIDLTPVASRLDGIEEALLAREGDGGRQIVERIAALERSITAQRKEVVEASAGQGAELKALVGAITTATSIIERQRGDMAGAMAGTITGSITEPLLSRFQALTAAIDQRTTESGRGVGLLGERVGGIERALATTTDRVNTAQTTWSRDLSEVHDAMHRLNNNQATLSAVIEKWRGEQAGDLGIIANRIEGIEHAGARPMALIEAMSAKIDKLEKATAERAHRHGRFWHWLFGTDDWIAASYPPSMPRPPVVSVQPPPAPTPIKKSMLR